MEPFERNSDFMDDASPYQDYYSTGGQYRPPRRPRNHGWLAATLGVLLLCVTAAAALSRSGQAVTPESAVTAARSSAQPTETAAQQEAARRRRYPGSGAVQRSGAGQRHDPDHFRLHRQYHGAAGYL